MTDLFIKTTARFSDCRTWRYELARVWDISLPVCLFVMLNPSTADEFVNDPTVERCQRFATRWGYGSLLVGNLFAYRATDPAVMKAARDPVGPGNDAALMNLVDAAGLVVCAWGCHGTYLDRAGQVLELIHSRGVVPHCLRKTKRGNPWHPLYLPSHLEPTPF